MFKVLIQFVLVSACLPLFVGAGERLRHRYSASGDIRVFLENADQDASAYALQIYDLLDDRSVGGGVSFQPSQMKGIMDTSLSTEDLDEGIYYMSVSSDKKRSVTTKPTRFTWDNEYLTQTVRIERKYEQLHWKPAVPCLARIVAVLPSGMTLDVVRGWSFYPASQQVLDYDFVGDDGRDIRAQANVSVFAQYITLPNSLVVVGNPSFEDYASTPLFQSLLLPVDQLTFELSTNAECLDVSRRLYQGGEDTTLKVTLSPETEKKLVGKRFEILIYLDGEFVHEEAQGTNPYTYILPKITASDHPQALTVNVLDYLGNWGAQTLTFDFPF